MLPKIAINLIKFYEREHEKYHYFIEFLRIESQIVYKYYSLTNNNNIGRFGQTSVRTKFSVQVVFQNTRGFFPETTCTG